MTTLPQGVDTQVFCYDDLARLTWAGSSGTPACSGAPTPGDTGSLSGADGASYAASYSYDSLNRLTSSPLGSYSYGDAAHPDAATAIGSAWTASYDAAGEMTCRAATSATTCAGSSPTGAQLRYDNEGQLAAWANAPGSSPTASASYLYDGEGNRVEQVATSSDVTTTTTYIGSLEEVATTGATTTTTAYYGGLATSVNGALSYTLSDGLGSVSEAVNAATGAVTATALYAPYGAVRYQSGTLPGSRGYTGQHSDATTSGLDYYGARYYDPAAGQFTSADTTLAGGLNRYAYVGGNPETFVDPTGFAPGLPCPEGMDPSDCIQLLLGLVQFAMTILFNIAGAHATIPVDSNGIPTVESTDTPIVRPTPSLENQYMQTLSDLGSGFNDNGNNPGNMPESGPGPNGEAPYDESPTSSGSVVYRYSDQRDPSKQDDHEGKPPEGGSGSAAAESGGGTAKRTRSSSESTDTNPFVLPGRVEAGYGLFGYTDLRNAQFGTAPVPSTASASSSDQSNPWQQLQQLLSPCACGTPASTQPSPGQVPSLNPDGSGFPGWSPEPSGAPVPDVEPVFGF